VSITKFSPKRVKKQKERIEIKKKTVNRQNNLHGEYSTLCKVLPTWIIVCSLFFKHLLPCFLNAQGKTECILPKVPLFARSMRKVNRGCPASFSLFFSFLFLTTNDIALVHAFFLKNDFAQVVKVMVFAFWKRYIVLKSGLADWSGTWLI